MCYVAFYQSYLKNSGFAEMFPHSHCSDSADSDNVMCVFIIILFIFDGWEPIIPGTVLIKGMDQSCQGHNQ